MKIKDTEITFKDLFAFDMSNHLSLFGGAFGIAHGLQSAAFMGVAFAIALYLPLYVGTGLIVAVWLISNFYWYKRETYDLAISLSDLPSNTYKALDKRLDFYVPLVFSTLIKLYWFYLFGSVILEKCCRGLF